MKRIFIMILMVIFICCGCKSTPLNNIESNTSIEVENEKENNEEEIIVLNEVNDEPEQIKKEGIEKDEIKSAEIEDANDTEEIVETNNTVDANIIEVKMKIIAKQGLNLRSYPHINSDKVELMPYASEVIIISDEKVRDTIDKEKGNWVKIKYNDKEGWAFDAYINGDVEEQPTFIEASSNIVNRSDIKTGDVINGLEVKIIEYDASTTSEIKIGFRGKISLTGELVRNKSGALLIPDKEYSQIIPKFDGGNEILYIVLGNFIEAEIKNNLSENVNRVHIELEGYEIKSKLLGEEEVPSYKANVLSISDTKVEGIIGYEGVNIEGCFIDDKLQIKDNICGLKVVSRSILNENYDLQPPLYTGSVLFDGEMILKATYNRVDEELDNGYIFNVEKGYYDKIPHFEIQETPNFMLASVDESLKEALGNKGEASLIIKNYKCKSTLEDIINTAELVEMISVEKEE